MAHAMKQAPGLPLMVCKKKNILSVHKNQAFFTKKSNKKQIWKQPQESDESVEVWIPFLNFMIICETIDVVYFNVLLVTGFELLDKHEMMVTNVQNELQVRFVECEIALSKNFEHI